jgi:hypothetical protein
VTVTDAGAVAGSSRPTVVLYERSLETPKQLGAIRGALHRRLAAHSDPSVFIIISAMDDPASVNANIVLKEECE